jgi:hypothetical protein
MRKMKTHREPCWLFGASRSRSAVRYRQHAPSALISAYRLSHLSVRAFSRLCTRFATAPPLDPPYSKRGQRKPTFAERFPHFGYAMLITLLARPSTSAAM